MTDRYLELETCNLSLGTEPGLWKLLIPLLLFSVHGAVSIRL